MVNSNDKKMPNGILEEQGIAHCVLVPGTGAGLSLKLVSLSSSSWAHAATCLLITQNFSVSELSVRGRFLCKESGCLRHFSL